MALDHFQEYGLLVLLMMVNLKICRLLIINSNNIIIIVPGPVDKLVALQTLNSFSLTWRRPRESYGPTESYEITYRLNNGSQLQRTNVPSKNDAESGHSFTLSSVALGTTVSDISVRAYNNLGGGKAATLSPIVITHGTDTAPTYSLGTATPQGMYVVQ